jgi:alpha-tubulin suppressor-like RCC1 family protein
LIFALFLALREAPSAPLAPVLAFGKNEQGQIGDGTTTTRLRPVAALLPSTPLAIGAGGAHGAALADDGRLWVWGGDKDGQLGRGPAGGVDAMRPLPLDGLDGLDGSARVTGLAIGYFHTLALREDGTVWAWGDNTYGQLGGETTERCGVVFCRRAPGRVEGLSDVVAIAAGFNHGLAQRRDGSVWSWGNGLVGQLGDGRRESSPMPRRVSLPSPAVATSAGGSQGLALLIDGSVWQWGSVDSAQTFCPTPYRVEGLPSIAAIAAGEHHALALSSDGLVYAWGDNTYGQLGEDGPPSRAIAGQVPRLTGIVAIAAGTNHNAALDRTGAVWTWGWNDSGQLGDGTFDTRAEPRPLEGVVGIRALGIGPDQVFLIR